MDNVESFLILYSRVFIAGIVTSLILGDILSILFLIIYFGYEFKLISVVYYQIPELYRTKYRNKLLSFLKWLCDVLEDNDKVINMATQFIELEETKDHEALDNQPNIEEITEKKRKRKTLKVKIRTPDTKLIDE